MQVEYTNHTEQDICSYENYLPDRPEDGEITNSNILEHRHERVKTAEVITDSIVDEQKIDVHAISSATNSSTVIKKSVENALKSRKLTTF